MTPARNSATREPRRQRANPGHTVAGLTIVEVLVAIVILGIALTAIGAMITGDLGLRRTSIASNTGVQLASSYLEAVKRAWSVPDNYEAQVGQPFGLLPDAPTDPRYSAYTMTLDITCLSTNGTEVACTAHPNPDLRRLSVEVSGPADQTVTRLVTEVGRPFEPARRR